MPGDHTSAPRPGEHTSAPRPSLSYHRRTGEADSPTPAEEAPHGIRPLLVVACVALIALTLPTVARADTIGPACWRPDGNLELYRLFFVLDPAQPVVASVLGEALPEDSASRPVSGSAVAGAAPNSVSMLLTVALEPSGPNFSTTYFVRADFSLTDLKGKMVCQLPGGQGGCVQGSFDWTPVACP